MTPSAQPLQFRRVPSSAGWFVAGFSDRGLATLTFPRRAPRGKLPPSSGRMSLRQRVWSARTRRAIEAALKRNRPGASLKLPPLDLTAGTQFQQQVWQELLLIPRGATRTYAELAARISRSSAARAVGTACGANPIPLLIPCHRVLAAGGKLGGFSGGLEWKRALLEREGVSWTEA